jgi:hypothetical protein
MRRHKRWYPELGFTVIPMPEPREPREQIAKGVVAGRGEAPATPPEPAPRFCSICGATEDHSLDERGKRRVELRPYGREGADICFPCAISTPELATIADRAIATKLVSAAALAASIGREGQGVVTITPDGIKAGLAAGIAAAVPTTRLERPAVTLTWVEAQELRGLLSFASGFIDARLSDHPSPDTARDRADAIARWAQAIAERMNADG